ncbi:MAG: DNA processing protein [Limisphaerales bacterium]|jgi:DNA processing protein
MKIGINAFQNAWRLSREIGLDPHKAASLMRLLAAENVLISSKSESFLLGEGIPVKVAMRLSEPLEEGHFKRFTEALEAHKIRAIPLTDTDYPIALNQIPDAPVMLYIKGELPVNVPSVALVGTRKCSGYGLTISAKLIREISLWKPLVISGLAYGIDTAVHRACVENGVPTLGVLAHGLDRIYPAVHQGIASEILKKGGALLSECPPGVGPRPFLFPKRNRIVAGLADGVIVVESGEKGGSLITAELAESYHREVGAVPGQADSPASKGCHTLIQTNRAALICNGLQIAQLLDWPLINVSPKIIDLSQFDDVQDGHKLIVKALSNHTSLHIDELVLQTGIAAGKLSALILDLELKGLVYKIDGLKYKIQSI